MKISVNDELKIVEVWLSKTENDDPVIQARLKSIYAAYKQKKYMVVVYKSGAQELYTHVRDLLAYNKTRCAEIAVMREAKQRQPFIAR